jgi:hypothetical protein
MAQAAIGEGEVGGGVKLRMCPACGRAVGVSGDPLAFPYHDSNPPQRGLCMNSKRAVKP